MVQEKTIRVFLSYSFDKSDENVIKTILGVFQQRKFQDRVTVFTAQQLAEQGLLNQIADCIDNCDVTLAIFTKRFDATGSDGKSVALPPPMLISEPSYALGSYRAFGQSKLVRGFCEKDIDFRNHLGLLSLPDIEWIVFERTDLPELKRKTKELAELLISQFGKAPRWLHLEYRQNSLEKRVSLFPDGSVITENRVSITVLDESTFVSVPHYIRRTDIKPLPSWKDWELISYKNRSDMHYFYLQLLEVNGRRDAEWIAEMQPETVHSDSNEAHFNIAFKHPHKRIKTKDIFSYQYVWNFPHSLALTKAELSASGINQAWMTSTVGPIRSAELTIRFDKALKLSKEPNCQHYSQVGMFYPNRPSLFSSEPDAVYERALTYSFSWKWSGFHGTALCSWIPD